MLSIATEIEDGSIEGLAEELMTIHEQCLEEDYNLQLNEVNPHAIAAGIRLWKLMITTTAAATAWDLGGIDSSNMIVYV